MTSFAYILSINLHPGINLAYSYVDIPFSCVWYCRICVTSYPLLYFLRMEEEIKLEVSYL